MSVFLTESLQSHSMFLINVPYNKQKILLQSGALMLKTQTLSNTLIEVHSAERNLTRRVNEIR